jgi:hypothetical protein
MVGFTGSAISDSRRTGHPGTVGRVISLAWGELETGEAGKKPGVDAGARRRRLIDSLPQRIVSEPTSCLTSVDSGIEVIHFNLEV